jgi:hypothetical protein
VRRKLAVIVGFTTFCAALAAFLLLGVDAQAGEVPVLAASHAIRAGQILQANSSDLSTDGTMVHLGETALADTFPQSDYRDIQGSVALVAIPAGSVILRSDVVIGSQSGIREVTLNLASMPAALSPGTRVDLLSVWGDETGAIAPGADLCQGAAGVGCVVPLAQSILVVAVDAPSHTITIEVTPSEVTSWLLLDATQPIWAVPAGAMACPGAEQAASNPAAALHSIQAPRPAGACAKGSDPVTSAP